MYSYNRPVASQWFLSGGISDLRTAQSSMRRGLAYSTRRVSRPDIVRSGACRRRHALPRLALVRPDRGVGVLEQAVRTLVLGLLKLGWTQHSNRFRSALDDRSALRSPALQHLLNEVDAR